jgi:hypothetical protein
VLVVRTVEMKTEPPTIRVVRYSEPRWLVLVEAATCNEIDALSSAAPGTEDTLLPVFELMDEVAGKAPGIV